MARVNVIVSAYNSADYTVESILCQTHRDFELLVDDDGSTDHTREALQAYEGRIRYIYKENGSCSAHDLGIRESAGEYVACLDCDDLWEPDKLEHSAAALGAHPDAALVFTGCYLIGAEGRVVDILHGLCEVDDDG